MVLPHYYARFIGGEITLNDEYSEYRWVNLRELDRFEPKIETVGRGGRTQTAQKTGRHAAHPAHGFRLVRGEGLRQRHSRTGGRSR